MLAEDVVSALDIPPFANSSMDGFALRAEDTRGATADDPVDLPIVQTIAAGAAQQQHLERGAAARIMTGAPLPPGADAAIPFEDVVETAGAIRIAAPVVVGACVRPAANDIRGGTTLLRPGCELHPAHIALIAAVGCAEVRVARRPTVAIISTGDELVEPGGELGPGQIYNSNAPMLAAAASEAGALPTVLPPVPDDVDTLRRALQQADGFDLIVTSGGASVGDFDYMKQVLGETGELEFWRVRVRPGKPLIFGTAGRSPLIGLPGNPTSAAVTFELFVRPALRAMVGASPYRPSVVAILDDEIDNRGGRRTYARVQLRSVGGAFHAQLAGSQDSAMLLPLARADGLLVVPEDCERALPGEEAATLVWHLPGPE